MPERRSFNKIYFINNSTIAEHEDDIHLYNLPFFLHHLVVGCKLLYKFEVFATYLAFQ